MRLPTITLFTVLATASAFTFAPTSTIRNHVNFVARSTTTIIMMSTPLDSTTEESIGSDSADAPAASSEEENKNKIFVGNVNFDDCTQDNITQLFSEFGEVESCQVPTDKYTGAPRGFGFVVFKNEEAVQKAVDAMNGKDLGGRELQVNECLPYGQAPENKRNKNKRLTKIFVGNLDFSITEEELQDLFEEFGEVTDAYLPTDRATGLKRGFGFVTMDREASYKAIDGMNGRDVYGRIITVNESVPRGAKAPRTPAKEMFDKSEDPSLSTRKLYVGNLPFEADEIAIRELYEQYGSVETVFRPIDRETGWSRGFAFVTMATEDGANAAIQETNEYEFGGRSLRVNIAQPRGGTSSSEGAEE